MTALWSAVWGRAFAAIYEPLLSGAEDAWLREERRALLSRAYGRVLEIGAGTGLNVPLYPETVTELVLTEPDRWMAERLAGRAGSAQVRLVPAEQLPFPDAHFDTAVSTLALCTVGDLDAALAEIARVLRPGGLLLFLEHVRADADADPRLARWQDRLRPVWSALARGCQTNRRTVAAIEASPLELLETRELPLPARATGPITRPMVVGSARA